MKPPEEQIPSRYTVVPFYVLAAVSFLILSVLCLIAASSFTGHYFQPKILAITHLAVFGWATMIIFGASNQLAPVISEQKLASEKLPLYTLFTLATGTVFLVWSFWSFVFAWYTYLGACLIIAGIILHTANMYNTVKKAKDNVINNLMITAHVWLLLTAIIGLMMLVHLRFPFLPLEHLHYLKIHASVGMAGWFIQLIVGVSSKLIPMFLLSRYEETKWLNVTYYAINAGLILFLLNGFLFQINFVMLLSILTVICGLLFYIKHIRVCYKTAMRKRQDQGMKQTLLALLLLSVPFILLLAIQLASKDVSANVITAYGFSFFAGFISVIIMGQTFKTLPFIVWMHITKPDQLPEIMPKDLYSEQRVKTQMLLYLPAFLIFLSGILLKQPLLLYVGAAVMTIASGLYLTHVLLIIKKLKSNV